MPRVSKAAATEALWHRGNLRFLLKPSQIKLDEPFKRSLDKKLFVSNCARRFGKTFWACTKAVEVALTCKNHRPRIVIATAAKTDVTEFIEPSFDFIFATCPPDLYPTYVRSRSKYIFPNGATIQLVGLDKRPDAGRGNYVDLYIFEEAGFISNLKYLYSSVVMPMTLRRPGSRIIIQSTPASTPAHPFQGFCERAKNQNSYIELNIHDNTELTAQDIADAKAECLTESDWLREYMCQHVVDETRAIVPEWNMAFCRTESRPAYFKYLNRYVSMDLGTKIDLTAILYAYYDDKKRIVVIEAEDDITGPLMTTLALKDIIVKREGALWDNREPARRVADNDNPLLLQDLGQAYGLHFVPTGKDELKAMVDQLRVMIKEGRVVVDPSCKKLIGCLQYGIWNKKRMQFDRSEFYGHFDHLAALIYLVRNIDYYTVTVPSDISLMSETSAFIRQSPEDKASAREIAKIFDN